MQNAGDTKVCPLCAETIKAAARRCPYCQKSQNRWVNLTSDNTLAVASAAILLVAFVLSGYFLTERRDFSSHHSEVKVLTSQMAETESLDTNKTLVVFGTLTNSGSYKWRLGSFEVRFFDKDGKLADVVSAGESFTLLPHSEHAYRLSVYDRKLDPLYASVRVYVRSADDPTKW